MDPLAVWGSITGTAGLLVAGRREWLASRKKMMVAPGVNLNTSLSDPGVITHGWALVSFYNGGGRDPCQLSALASAGLLARRKVIWFISGIGMPESRLTNRSRCP
jgi:hypothetical protein